MKTKNKVPAVIKNKIIELNQIQHQLLMVYKTLNDQKKLIENQLTEAKAKIYAYPGNEVILNQEKPEWEIKVDGELQCAELYFEGEKVADVGITSGRESVDKNKLALMFPKAYKECVTTGKNSLRLNLK